ncbi:UDP-glucuronic acid decarboxylase family protein [Streptomyces endophyticus]|uniref:SDR family oxidoreductase n=1 Tax=Streptomyces endophyticus TaxID=714166 RepID=A0ABU6FHU7_9ACTN|nr:UDP-glucuronic acid decarboxylase family protein [Streptomyces endophyticus]MEB8342357.1 SDR family oxidoreductase [Streptomyces endophyticus]
MLTSVPPLQVPEYQRLRIVITGGAGFIGSHLCDRLLADGHSVLCFDDLSTGRMDNLAACLPHPRFSFVRHDVAEEFDCEGPVAAVAHLACPASPQDYLHRPIETLRTGSLGTLNALSLAKRKGARLLYASTSESYGDPEIHPQPEGYWGHVNPVGPRAVYDESKRFGEAAAAAYRRKHGVSTGIVRIFNTYGPRMRAQDGRVVPAFITRALVDEALLLHGDGAQTRSFCHVDDLVEGLVSMLECDHAGPINLGNPEEVTMLELASLVQELTGSRAGMTRGPALEDDPSRRMPDITLAGTALAWRPTISLAEGLARTIAWFTNCQQLSGTAGRDPEVAAPGAH